MPLTGTLKTAAELRLAGFPESQAVVLAEKFEEVGQAVSEDLKTFISGELDRKLGALEGRMQVQVAGLRTELHSSLRDQTMKMMAILVAAISLAVAIIKLFPNAH